MKTSIFLTLSLLCAAANANEVQPSAPQIRGINETVVISFRETVWASDLVNRGFYQGTYPLYMVPVTREAAQVLNGLKRTSKYQCVLLNSTFVPVGYGTEMTGGTYYIQDINCD